MCGSQGFDTIMWALQFAAKLYELLVASLSAIILHHMRHEILFGEGVPLGIFGSALSFQQLSYIPLVSGILGGMGAGETVEASGSSRISSNLHNRRHISQRF